jgi:uncharacterized membrane protein HdeD (DUF308 family)
MPAEFGGLVFNIPDVSRMMVIRGGVGIVFGLVALIWPQLTILVIALAFGIYAIVDGIGLLFAAFRDHRGSPRWLQAVGGVVGVAVGALALFWPGVTVLVLAIMVGAWAVVTGITEIVSAVRLRKEIRGEGWLAALGAISVIAGVLILFQPIAGALGIAILIGAYAVVYGVMLVVLGIRMRSAVRQAT